MSDSIIVQIFPTDAARAHWERPGDFLLVEFPLPDLGQVVSALSAGGFVRGDVLSTRPGEQRGERVIFRRLPAAFSAAGIARVSLPILTFIEQPEAA